MALNLLQTINVLLDRNFVGHLSAHALAAQGASLSTLFMLFSFAMAIGTAGTAIVSRAFGAENGEEVKEGATQAARVAFVGGIFCTLVAILCSKFLSTVFLPPDALEAQAEMAQYLFAYAFGLSGVFLIQALAGALRAVGDTFSPLIISGIQILIHMALNFLFVPRFGLTGTALALTVSSLLSAAGYLVYTKRTKLGSVSGIGLPKWHWVVRIIRIAAPASLLGLLRVTSLAAFTLILKQTPTGGSAIAGMGLAFALEAILFMPGFGLGMASAALVGQNLGANNPKLAEKFGWMAAHSAAIITLALVLPLYIFAPAIANSLTGGKVEIVREAVTLLRLLCLTELLFSYSMVLTSSLQGAGDTVRPLWINLITMWLCRIPLAYFLALKFGLGSYGAWLGMSGSQGVGGILAVLAWRQGTWKTTKV